MLTYLSIIVTAIFINNIVFAQFLGICPFLGVSKKTSSALGMGAAVTFVITLSTIVAWLLQYYVLNPLDLGFLQTIVFILVIAFLVQMLEIVMKKIAPALYKSLGVFLPLITTNRARCRHSCDTEGFQSYGVRYLRLCDFSWLYTGSVDFCWDKGTA